MLQSHSARGLLSIFVWFYFCVVFYIIYSFQLMSQKNCKEESSSICSLRFSRYQHFLVYTDTQQSCLFIYLFFGCWRQTSLLKILPKFWQTFQNRFVNIMLPFSTGSTLKRQYDKTTQLESTLVQNPYIFDHITYVPT